MCDYIDKTEAELIQKFFGIDCYDIDKHRSEIETLPREMTRVFRYLGMSRFKNIIEFYSFEFKPRETKFWELLNPIINKLDNIELSLIMSKVDLDYFWLDYVTDVNIQFKVESNNLIITSDIGTQHLGVLELICHMMFISDFNESQEKYKNIDVELAWQWIDIKLKELNG